MPDFNQVLATGDLNNNLVNAVIEIPMGSHLKIEYDRNNACFFVDRVEPDIYPKPANYGFIPKTKDEDGDELDILVVTSEPIPTGVYLSCKVIGVLMFEDDGEGDHKIIAVPSDDRDSGDRINSLEDLGERWQQKVTEHFTHYKDLKKPGSTKVHGWGDVNQAKQIIQESIERYGS